MRFPRPRGTVPCGPAGPGTAEGQRPARRARSARRGRVGRWPGAVAPGWSMIPAWRCGRGDGPCQRSDEGAVVSAGGNRKRDPRFPRPCGTVPRRPVGPGTTKGRRPTRRGRSARHGRGGRWPGALGPRPGKDQPGAVAGAMAPAIEAVTLPSPLRAGSGNATRVSPARAGRCPVDRQVREHRRPAPDPAGEKRPPGAGRALAGGLRAPGWSRISAMLWQGRWPLPGCARRADARGSRFSVRQPPRPTLFQQPKG